jgi:hypothetical protein
MPLPRFLNTFLDAPILRGERDKIFLDIVLSRLTPSHVKTLKRADQVFIRQLNELTRDREVQTLNPEHYPDLVDRLCLHCDKLDLSEVIGIAKSLITRADKALVNWGLPHGVTNEGADGLVLGANAQLYYNALAPLRRWVDAIHLSRSRGGIGAIQETSGGLNILANEYIGAIWFTEDPSVFIVSYEQILMLKDMLWGRANALLTAGTVYKDDELENLLLYCFQWCFDCLHQFGNRGYSLVKEIEPISKIAFLSRTERIMDASFIERDVLNNVREKERNLRGSDPFLVDALYEKLKSSKETQYLVEVFGLQKLSGHPLLDPREGGESVIAEARSRSSYDPTYVLKLRNNFCRMYTEGYIRKRREWPPLLFYPEGKQTRMYELYCRNETKITPSSYSLDDWTHVKFQKHHDYNYFQNFTDLMDDRSLSYYRDNVATTWDRHQAPRSNRRVLLELLSREHTSVHDIVKQVQNGQIPWEWLIITLYPKEREFKLTPRMFSMMVFEMRIYFAACEANLADNIFPYLPQQTMTLSKAEIKELFHVATKILETDDAVRLFAEFDIERWNLHWYDIVVDPVSRCIDDMHGTPGMFTTAHHFFKKCAVIVRTQSYPPPYIHLAQDPRSDLRQIESNLLWTDHEPGFEGLFQKGWTCVTYSMIDLGIQDLGLSYYLLGQGDNQIILSYIDCQNVVDRGRYVQEIAEKMVQNVGESCRRAGQKLKEDECILSTGGITYSKDVYLNGIEHYSTIKAFSRIFPNSSSDFPTVSNNLGAISSGCVAGAERLKHPHRGYYLWAFHASFYLVWIRDVACVDTSVLIPEDKKRLSGSTIGAILSLSAGFGGLNIATPLDFLYKGGADPLSKEYAFLALSQSFSRFSRRVISCLKSGLWMDPQPDVTRILEDPYSIPLLLPTDAETRILNRSMSRVFSITKNQEIKDIMSLSSSRYEEELKNCLCQVRPFSPVLLADVLSLSCAGFKKTIGKMFTSTRTIQSLLQGDQELNPCRQIVISGATRLVHVMEKVLRLPSVESTSSSIYQDVEFLRAHWGIECGLKIVGVTAYTPFEHQLLLSSYPLLKNGVRGALLHHTGYQASFQRGPEQPYVGRDTREKRSEHGYKIIVNSASDQAVSRLAKIMTQPGAGRSFKEMVSSVAQTRANVDLIEIEDKLSHDEGGSVAHRYESLLGHRGAYGLGSMILSSNCVVSTNNALPVSGGEVDFPKMMQEDMVALIAVLQADSVYSAGRRFACLVYTPDTFVSLGDEELLSPEPPIPYVSLGGSNHLLYTPEVIVESTSEVRSSAMIGFVTDHDIQRSGPLYALRRLCSRSLERAHTANAISDYLGGTVMVNLDILELRGAGLRGFIECCSHAIASYACNRIYTRYRFQDRWAPLPSVTALAAGFARGIQPKLTHSLIRDDPYLLNLGGVETLRYRVGRIGITAKIADRISNLTMRYLLDPSSTFHTSLEVLFADEFQGIVPRVIVSYLHRGLFASYQRGELGERDMYLISSKFIPSLLRHDRTPRGKVGTLQMGCVQLVRWAHQTGIRSLQKCLNRLLDSRAILFSPKSAVAALRQARVYVRPELYWTPGSNGELAICRDSRCDWRPLLGDQLPGLLPDYHWCVRHNRNTYDLYSAFRIWGRLYGFSSSVGYSYWPITQMCRGKIVCLIGCGYGSGAAVLLELGAAHVYGLDLTMDLSSKYSLDIPPYPPAIARRADRHRFSRIDPDQVGTGDFRDLDVVSLIRTGLAPGSVWVIDIPITDRQSMLSVLRNIGAVGYQILFALRWIGTTILLSDIVSTLGASGWLKSLFEISRKWGYVEAWVVFTPTPTGQLTASYPLQIPSTSILRSPRISMDFLGGGTEYLERTVLRFIYDVTPKSESIIESSYWGLIEESIGELEHRYSYTQWTDLLHAFVSLAILSSPVPFMSIARILECDIITLSIHKRSIEVAVTPHLRRLITRDIPRLLINEVTPITDCP